MEDRDDSIYLKKMTKIAIVIFAFGYIMGFFYIIVSGQIDIKKLLFNNKKECVEMMAKRDVDLMQGDVKISIPKGTRLISTYGAKGISDEDPSHELRLHLYDLSDVILELRHEEEFEIISAEPNYFRIVN